MCFYLPFFGKKIIQRQKKQYENFKKVRKVMQERKRTSTCEFWRRKKPKLISSSTANSSNVQRIQLGQQQQQAQQIVNNNNNPGTYSLVMSSASTSAASNQTFITGRLINSSATSVSTVYNGPQISSIRSTRPVNAVSSIPPSVAQPMSGKI